VTVVVFSGPTIAPREVAERSRGATCLGPAACGDVFRAHARGAGTIVLIDGYFEHARSVWHKELLWALRGGTRVYGASSLGALRAVELAPFGMVGMGRVFEQFRDGVLEDDDEVTLAHEAAERDYRPISEALVNIRSTLAAATQAGVLTAATASALVAVQKARFYPARSLDGLAGAPDCASIDVDWSELARWLATGRVDQKRADALAVLDEVAERSGRPPAPAFDFAHTDAWHAFMKEEGR
jgi:hypothetical protein